MRKRKQYQFRQRGFTLIEAIIVLAVAGILMMIGVPALGDYMKNSRLTANTNKLVGALNFARNEAITLDREVSISALSPKGTDNEWGVGWEVWVDGHPNCIPRQQPDTAKQDCEVSRIFEIADPNTAANKMPIAINGPDDLAVISMANVSDVMLNKTISYRSDGSLAISAAEINFFVCDSRRGEKGRQVRLLRTGRIVLQNREYQCE